MNYMETPICEEPMREIPMKEALNGIQKKLTEVDLCLMAIISGMIGAPNLNEEVQEGREARCMQDQINLIDGLSDSLIGLSHRIKQLMF